MGIDYRIAFIWLLNSKPSVSQEEEEHLLRDIEKRVYLNSKLVADLQYSTS